MKSLITFILLIGAALSYAQDYDYEVHIRELWVEQNNTPGKQYIASLGHDVFHENNQILIFGEKSKQMRSRFVNTGYARIPVLLHKTKVFKDDFYEITMTRTDENTIAVHMLGNKPGFEYFLTYKKLNDHQFKKNQSKAWPIILKEYDRLAKIANMHTPKSIRDLQSLAKLLNNIDPYYTYNDVVFWPFAETLDEIYAEITTTPAQKKIAKSKVKSNAKDLISKTFNKEKEWTKEDDLPSLEYLFFQAKGDYKILSKSYYTYYHSLPEGNLLKGSFKRGLEKFLKVAIVIRSPWSCEDDYAWQEDYIWILKDGSSIKYTSEFECD